MPTKYRLLRDEMTDAARELNARDSMHRGDLAEVLQMSIYRAGAILDVIGARIQRPKGAAVKGAYQQFALRPDWAHAMARELNEQPVFSRIPKAYRMQSTPAADPSLYPTGDPSHFDTDWLGRVVYRGAA